MTVNAFNPIQFYSSYPRKVIARPGYPGRAVFKSTYIFKKYGKRIINEIGSIDTYADIGGCFGFGANAMAFHISKQQGSQPRTAVFEISPEFVRTGKILFPYIEFIEENFSDWKGDIPCFDVITLLDVIEHVVDPGSFLRDISAKSKYVLLKTPMETSGEWRGNKPPINQGENHVDGHINFFTPKSYERLLEASNLDIVESHMIRTIVPSNAMAILVPEQPNTTGLKNAFRQPKRVFIDVLRNFPGVPWKLKRKIFGGGDHICLCKSRLF
jgi:hypothetical protein